MRRATITEAKNRLSALIDQVRAGETVVIGRPRRIGDDQPVLIFNRLTR